MRTMIKLTVWGAFAAALLAAPVSAQTVRGAVLHAKRRHSMRQRLTHQRSRDLAMIGRAVEPPDES